MKRRTIFVAVAALAACGVACSGSKGEVKQAPHIEVEPATLTPVIDEGAIPLNDTYSYQIRVYNTGNMPLHLSAVSMAYQKCPGEEDANQAFTMTSGTVPATIAPQGKGTPDTPESLMINVIYKRLAVTCERIAEVAIDNDDPDVNRRHLVLRFSVNKPVPHLEADEVVDFGFVASGQPAVEQFLTLNNTGQGPVTVTGINYIGQEGFSFVWKCKHKPGVADLEIEELIDKDAPFPHHVLAGDSEIRGTGRHVFRDINRPGEKNLYMRVKGLCNQPPLSVVDVESALLYQIHDRLGDPSFVRDRQPEDTTVRCRFMPRRRLILGSLLRPFRTS